MFTDEVKETGCCKRFNPEPWNDKQIHFRDTLFIKDRILSFVYVPLNYGMVMRRNLHKMERAGSKMLKPLIITDKSTLWGADVYLQVDQIIPDAQMVSLSADFLAKVFEGPFSDLGKWLQEMKKFLTYKGKAMKKIYFYHTTCPACAREYGKNFTVLLAEL